MPAKDQEGPSKDPQQPSGAAVASASGEKDSSRVVHALVNELAKLGFLCWLIAWALSSTSAADSACFQALLNFTAAFINEPSTILLHRHQQVLLVEPATSRFTASVRLLALESNQ